MVTKTINFYDVFERKTYLGNVRWICNNLEKLKGNFIITWPFNNFEINQLRHDITGEINNFFTTRLLGTFNPEIDYWEITPDLYHLNIDIKKLHPNYQVLYDEMVQTQRVKYFLITHYNEEFYLSIDVDHPDYWLAGNAFEYAITLNDFKLIDLEES